jgi:LPS sulfotransferase NodH
MFNFNKFPILLLSTPRTGSSALGSYIQDMHQELAFFNEPDNSVERINGFTNKILNNKNYLLKAHLYNIHLYPNHNFLCYSDEIFRIRLRRKNFVEQAVSFYIAKKRNEKWSYKSEEEVNLSKLDHIPLDIELAGKSVDFLKKVNKILDDTDIKFDLDLFYEDLTLDNSRYFPTPLPANYQELKKLFYSLS